MKFRDFKYEMPDMEELEREYRELLQVVDNGESFKEVEYAVDRINGIRNNLHSMGRLMGIRYSLDTNDQFNQKEIAKIYRVFPKLNQFDNEFYRSLLKSKYADRLKEKLGERLFTLAQGDAEIRSSEIIEELKEESELQLEFHRIKNSMKCNFRGEDISISRLAKYFQSEDRSIRKDSNEAYWNAYGEKSEEIEEVFHRLVKVRNRMAKKLGFENYVEFKHPKTSRSDYDYRMVRNFREGIKQNIVPLNRILLQNQRKRLGLDKLKDYDRLLKTKGGGAKLQGDSNWLLENTRRIFNELSPETKKFFNEMVDRELMDLQIKEGKTPGAYASYIHNEKAPFIFANLRGLGADAKTLMHEGGHAFQLYMSREYDILEYRFPSTKIMEIHSMSMELLTSPFMERLFGEDVDKFNFRNINMGIDYIIMSAQGDEFEDYVYSNPEATKEQRCNKWLEIEKGYDPDIDYGGISMLERGRGWMKIGQIIDSPFYFISYAFAQICAFQFWVKAQEDREGAWNDYVNLCRAGGSKSFLELLKVANLRNPFDTETFKWVVPPVKKWLLEHGE